MSGSVEGLSRIIHTFGNEKAFFWFLVAGQTVSAGAAGASEE